MQVHDRAPAARDRHQVARQRGDRPGDGRASCVERHHVDRGDASPATGVDDDRVVDHLDARRARALGQLAARRRACVDNRSHRDTGRSEAQRSSIGAVVVGEHDRPRARPHPIAIHERGNRRGEHHAGSIVVREYERPLDGARRQHDLVRPHSPQALARPRALFWRQVVGQALGDREEIVVVVAEHRAARQEPHLGHRSEVRDRPRDPRHRRAAANRAVGRRIRGSRRDVAMGKQAAAELALLVGEDHSRTCLSGSPRRGETGRTGAHDQHVAVGVHPVVMVGIRCRRRRTQTGRHANQLLVALPHALRPHERLVVEAGRHEAREQARDRHQIEFDTRPGVYAVRHETVVERDLGCSRVRHRTGTRSQLHDGVGLLDTTRDNAARTMVFPAARDHVDAIGQQCRGERVARKALVALAVEREREPRPAIDASTGGQSTDLRHALPPGGASPTLYTAVIR